MDSVYDRVHQALKTLEWEGDELYREWCCGITSGQVASRTFMGNRDKFERNCRFLKIFVDFIYKWADAKDIDEVLNLGSFVNKIKATMQKIGQQLCRNIDLPVRRDPSWTILIPCLRIMNQYKYQEERLSMFSHVFSKLESKIELLKPEIGEACDTLLSHSFQSHFGMHDFGHWKKIVKFVETNLDFFQKEFDSTLREKIEPIKLKLKLFRAFLASLRNGPPKNPEIQDVWIPFASVPMRIALLFFQCWAGKTDPNMKDHMSSALLDLQRIIDSTNPEFVCMNLRLLNAFQASTRKKSVNRLAKLFDLLVPYQEGYIEKETGVVMPYSLHSEMKSLTISVINIPEEFAEDKHMFLEDVKMVFVAAEPFKRLLGICKSSRGKLGARTALLYLLPKIWLIMMEKHLRLQLPNLQSMEEQIDSLNQGVKDLDLEVKLSLIRKLIEDSQEGSIKYMKEVLTLMEEFVRVPASLDYSIQAENLTRKVRNLLFKLLLSVVLFRAESDILELCSKKESWIFFVKDQVEALHEGLKLLIMFVRYQPEDDVEEGKVIFNNIDTLARGILSLCSSFPANNITEEMINSVNLRLCDLSKKMKVTLVELKGGYLDVPRSNFPKTNAMGFINSLLIKLRELLDYKADLIASMKHQIEEIMRDLEFLTPFLGAILEHDVELQEFKDLGACIINVAYEAECFIDSMVLKESVEWHNSLWLYHLLEDIRLVKKRATKTYNEAYHVKVQNVPQTAVYREPGASTPRIDEAVVVLDDQETMIIDRLIGGTQQLDIVPIVGMPGIGKTTLAKQVYNSPSIVAHFHIRAWCSVSEIYRKREVLLEILSHITPLTDEILGMTDEDLDFKLLKLLLKNKYLIVMDDAWNTEALENLKGSLPNDGIGSRILLTSRHHHVALKANPLADPHCLRQLSDAESWNLLQMKLFHEQLCPEELREIGEKIAESCRGLPLAIVAMAGLLERIDMQHNRWKEIAEDLRSQIVNHPQEQCRKILELSYKHLPDFLKACFLYLGAFLEDQDIPAKKLTRLWIAEGFVQKTELKSLEDLAEDYLTDLIGRSLVILTQKRARGGAKTCRVHDVLRRLCQSKAKEDRFLQVMTGSNESSASFHDLDYAVSDNFCNPSSSTRYEDHRLCFCYEREHFIQSRPSGPHVRSLLFIATNDPRCPYDVSFICHSFRLLKVLDLECINMGTAFPSGLELLVHLRYLAVVGYIDSVPSSIANLWNLETFVVKGLKGKVKLPDTIWCLKKLRHVHVSGIAVMSLQDDQHEIPFLLDYLVTLSSPFFRFGEYTDNILRRFPNLRKLKCIFAESWDDSQNCNQFPRLDVLAQLESVKISYYGRALHPGEFNFPMNLKKLSLSNFHLPWNKISVIGQLPNLEVLKLLSGAFDGARWDMMEGEFLELKYLKLDTLNIAKWNACSDHLPKLQQLVLRCCMHLEEVPSSIAEIPTLQKIDVQWCGDRVEKSVRQMKEEGDEKLKVFINLAELDFSSTTD